MSYIGKSPSGSGVRTRYYFTQSSGGGTSISGTDDNGKTLTYTDGEYVDVYLNGVLLVHGTDYGTGTANTISSLAALAGGDVVEVVVYDIFNVAKINNEAVRKRYYKTASGSETSISGADDSGATITFPANAEIEVKLNGVALVQGTDYNTTTANTVGGLSALSAGQVVEVVVYERFVLGDTVSKADGGTFLGNVGFSGTTTGLDLNGTELILDADADTSITADTDDQIDFKVGGSDKVTINSTGVGIGNSSPSHLVDAVVSSGSATARFGTTHNSGSNDGTVIISNGGSGDAMLRFDYEGTNTDRARIGVSSSGQQLEFYTAGDNERMRIDSNGKVLMGASSAPNQACEVFINDTLMIGRGDQNITGSLSTSGLIINAQTGSFIMTLYDDNDTANPRLTLNRNGDFAVTGSLSKGSGSFRIDHPLPAKNSTHHLIHSFIEGPQADLIYRGKVDLVAGSATVNIDTASGMTEGTFVLLCDDVQCFTSNEDGFTAVKGSVSGNALTITAEDNTCTDTISWMVIGERKDQHMLDTDWTDDNGKVIVEPLKGAAE